MNVQSISHEHIVMIVTTIIVGTLAKILNIKEDFRQQYPSDPNGYMIHLVTGFIAAALGAVAIPALMTKNNYNESPVSSRAYSHFQGIHSCSL